MNDWLALAAIAVLTPAAVLFLIFAVREQGKGHRAQSEGVDSETPQRSDAEVGRAA